MVLNLPLDLGVVLEKIQFKGACPLYFLQLLTIYSSIYNKISYIKLLYYIGQNCIGNREGRIEPRAIKKRHNGYSLLMKPRKIAQEEIRKNGHPKKLK